MNELPGFDTKAVLALTGITVRQLHHWDQLGIVSPSVQPALGSGSRRRYSSDDVFRLLLAQTLRDENRTLDAVQKVVSAVNMNGIDLHCAADIVLAFSEGAIHYVGEDRARLVDVLEAAPVVSVVNLGEVASRARRMLETVVKSATDLLAVGDRTYQVLVARVAAGWEARCRAFPDQTGRGENAAQAVESLRTQVHEALARAEPSRAERVPGRRAPAANRASAWGDAW